MRTSGLGARRAISSGLGTRSAVIDKNPKAFERLRQTSRARRSSGFVFDREVLEEAGIKEAAAFASVTSGDNSNIVSARVAKEHYRVPQVVARIYDPRRAQIYQRLGIQTVATVRWTTDQILRSDASRRDSRRVHGRQRRGRRDCRARSAEMVGKHAAGHRHRWPQASRSQ